MFLLHLNTLKVAKTTNSLTFSEVEKDSHLKLLLCPWPSLMWPDLLQNLKNAMFGSVLKCMTSRPKGLGWINANLNQSITVWQGYKRSKPGSLRCYLNLVNTCARMLYLALKIFLSLVPWLFLQAVLHIVWLYAPGHEICYIHFFFYSENSGSETSKQNSGHYQQAESRYMRHKYEHSSELEIINR